MAADRKSGVSPQPILKRQVSNQGSGRNMRTIKEDATAVDEDSWYDSRSPYQGNMGHSKSKDVLDESVRDPHRPPQRLDGLLDFL